MKEHEKYICKKLSDAGVDPTKTKLHFTLQNIREDIKKNSPKIRNIAMQDARFKSLEDLLKKTVHEIETWADDKETLRDLNPLYAHIKIAQILNDIIPMLKHLCGED